MRNTCQKHKKEVEKYDGTINELADDISNLHYKSLEHLLDRLSGKLFLDSMEDTKGGRNRLAKALNEASKEVGKAKKSVEEACIISKPYM
jgi:peptide deformylase